MRNKGNLYIVVTAILWSMGGLLIKFVPWNALALNGVRNIIAFMIFAIYWRKIKIKLNKTIIAAALCLAATTILFAVANKLTTAANAIVLQYLAPAFVLIWDSLYKKQKPPLSQVAVIFAAFAGMVLFFLDSLDSGSLLGNLLAVGSGLTFSGVFFFNSLPDSSSEDACMLSQLISFAVAIPFFSQCGKLDTAGTLSILALGVFQMGLSYVLFSKGTKLTTPVDASLISLLEALLNPLWVFLFIGERISGYALVGGAIILASVIAGILLTSRQEKKKTELLQVPSES